MSPATLNGHAGAHLDRLLSALKGVRASDNGYEACCPAHDDQRASLSISTGDDGRILLHCQTGCSPADVVRSVGLTLADLFLPREQNGHAGNGHAKRSKGFGKIVATYPYHDENKKLLYEVVRLEPKDFRQRRPDGKGGWTWRLGKTRRVLFGLPRVLASDPKHTVYLVEGEKGANSLLKQSLIATCSPGGAGKWSRDYAEPLRDRCVAILPDNDAPGYAHALDVARGLHGIAKAIRIVELPNLPEKGDVADYFANGGTREAFIELVKSTPDWEPSAEDQAKIDQADSAAVVVKVSAREGLDPAIDAQAYLNSINVDGISRLVFWRGGFWLWEHGKYTERQQSEIRACVIRDLNSRYKDLGVQSVNAVMDQIKAQAYLSSSIEPPVWIDSAPVGAADWNPKEILATRNAIVHLPSYLAGSSFQLPATPRFFSTSCLSFDFEPDTGPPTRWLDFLWQLWPGDQQAIDLLQMWMGYCLMPDTSQQRLLMLLGPTRCGKGTIARVLKHLVGDHNCAGPQFTSLAGPFGLQPLIGKSLAIVPDARLGLRPDQLAIIAERILAITGQDQLTIDRKNRESIDCTLPTKLMILSNELPRLPDSSGALAKRFLILRCAKNFYGREDEELTAKLLGEASRILLWAVEGWRRLREQRRFVQPVSGQESVADLANLSSPVAEFVDDWCLLGPHDECSIKVDLLYNAWQKWCGSVGERRPTVRTVFGRDLKAAFPSINAKQQREGSVRTWVYYGIDLSPEVKAEFVF